MAIRFGNSCANCENLSAKEICEVHSVKVSNSYTCDSFEMKTSLKNDPNCTTCVHFEKTECANPQKATIGMSCSHWAPQEARA